MKSEAEGLAEEYREKTCSHEYCEHCDPAFLAGYHSRDAEVERLRGVLGMLAKSDCECLEYARCYCGVRIAREALEATKEKD